MSKRQKAAGNMVRVLFALFVVVHLVIDLAMPSFGAFRFDMSESQVGVRVHHAAQSDALKFVPHQDQVWISSSLPRPDVHAFSAARRSPHISVLLSLLPRRDPSSERPPPAIAEDH